MAIGGDEQLWTETIVHFLACHLVLYRIPGFNASRGLGVLGIQLRAMFQDCAYMGIAILFSMWNHNHAVNSLHEVALRSLVSTQLILKNARWRHEERSLLLELARSPILSQAVVQDNILGWKGETPKRPSPGQIRAGPYKYIWVQEYPVLVHPSLVTVLSRYLCFFLFCKYGNPVAKPRNDILKWNRLKTKVSGRCRPSCLR